MARPPVALSKHRLTNWLIIFGLWCTNLIFWSTASRAFCADFTPDPAITRNLPTKNESLSPVQIDENYLRNEIPGEEKTSTVTLKGAVIEAEARNRVVQTAKLQAERFKWDILATESQRLPNIHVLSFLGYETISSVLVPNRPNAFFFTTAFLPLTQHYRIGLEARVARFTREIAMQRLRQEVDETRSKVKTNYYKLVLDQSLLADLDDSIQYLTELEKTVGDQVKQGNSLKVEQMEVEAHLATTKYERTKTLNTYNIDCEKLNHLLGRDLKTHIKLEAIPPPDESELNVAEAEQKALAMRPEIRQADARVKQIDAERKFFMSQYIPNVSVGVVYLGLPGYNDAVLPKNSLSPGIFINWNAFDWGRKVMQSKAAAKNERGAIQTAQNTRDEVIIDLHTQINKLTESRMLIQTTRFARSTSREGLRVAMNRYKYTSAKLSDVLQAETSLSDANNKYHEALLAFWEAKAEFERAVGEE
jgi:outer membrane protein